MFILYIRTKCQICTKRCKTFKPTVEANEENRIGMKYFYLYYTLLLNEINSHSYYT